MKLCVLGSGSRGNAILMQAGTTRILVDAGFAPRAMARRLGAIGVDPASISAVIVTHEHTDHAKGAAAGAARWGWRVFATPGTRAASVSLAKTPVQTISSSGSFTIGDIELMTVGTSHDADEPIAVVASCPVTGSRAAIVYDLGVMTEAVQRAVAGVNVLVLESNHDVAMLRNGPYPVSLQRRIASRHGHLSNQAAGRAAVRCSHRGLAHVVLAHLSEINNTPAVATEAMLRALARTEFRGTVTAAGQDAPSATISATRSKHFGSDQLSLGL